MKHTRMLRTRAGLAVSVVLASGAAVVGTAGEAAAASACNTTSISSKSFIEWRGEARIPARRDDLRLTLTCEMSQGATGSHVRALQVSLNKCYDESLTEDGIFGTKTRDALKRAQSEERIGVDGIYGPQTRDALSWYYRPVTPGSDECSRL